MIKSLFSLFFVLYFLTGCANKKSEITKSYFTDYKVITLNIFDKPRLLRCFKPKDGSLQISRVSFFALIIIYYLCTFIFNMIKYIYNQNIHIRIFFRGYITTKIPKYELLRCADILLLPFTYAYGNGTIDALILSKIFLN